MHIYDISVNARVWGTFNLLLVPEENFTTEYLNRIRQVGYVN